MDIRQQIVVRILFVIAKIVAIGGDSEMALEIKNLGNHINTVRFTQ